MIYTKVVCATKLSMYGPELKSMEEEQLYPLSGSTFKISHGDSYSDFFLKLGKPYFVLAFDNDDLVGCMVIVLKKIKVNNKTKRAVYLCDLKLRNGYKSLGISKKIYRTTFWWMIRTGKVFSLPFVYFVAMQDKEKGDFIQSSNTFLTTKLFKCVSCLNIYFSQPEKLRQLESVQRVTSGELRLSLTREDDNTTTNLAGLKELINTKTKEPIKLLHIAAHQGFSEDTLEYLSKVVKLTNMDHKICFAVDRKELYITDELAKANVEISGTSKIYCLRWDAWRFSRLSTWIGTNEI